MCSIFEHAGKSYHVDLSCAYILKLKGTLCFVAMKVPVNPLSLVLKWYCDCMGCTPMRGKWYFNMTTPSCVVTDQVGVVHQSVQGVSF